MTRNCTSVILSNYALGDSPPAQCFRLKAVPIPEPLAGEVVVEVHFLSMDPFPRLRIRGDNVMAPPLALGSVMIGRGAGRVVASRHASLREGDWVAGELGWQEYVRHNGADLIHVNPDHGPLSASLGVLGPTGLAAYFAVLRQGRPRQGESVVVSAAAGAVGSIATQIAMMQGARVIGLALGEPQQRYLRDEIGVAATVECGEPSRLAQALKAACPQGVDVFMDGVGGVVHDAVMHCLNVNARVVVYGLISSYGQPSNALDVGPRHLYQLIRNRVRMTGFLVGDYSAVYPEALSALAEWLRQGKLQFRETIVHGIEQTPAAFSALFAGSIVGKQLVKLAAAER